MNTRSTVVVALLAACTFTASLAHAQLTPDRTYYGVNRPMPMKAVVPAEAKGEVSVQLFTYGVAEPAAKASASAGAVDLVSLFPQLTKEDQAKVYYAQLVAGEQKVGAPVVLQPLTPPPVGRQAGASIQFMTGGPKTLSGYRAYPEKHAVLETSLGTMKFLFRPDQAPNTAWNFMELVRGGLYTDVIFHRIMGPDFMAQCGDPTGTGGGGPGYNIDLENSKLPHDFGVLSMARTPLPDSAGSQFFLCFTREGTRSLDGSYCSFAQIVEGGDVISKLIKVETIPAENGERSKPKDPPKLISARLVDAPPFGTARALTKAEETPAGR